MGQAIAVRRDFTSEEVRQLAKRAKDSSQARRLLAIAAVLDGASRQDAAKTAGMDRQTLRDWVIRFNEKGANGLVNMERLPSSMTGTRLFSLGSWRRARCRRCMAWCAGGPAI